MPFAEPNDPIETLAPCGPDDAFTMRVRLRRLWLPETQSDEDDKHRVNRRTSFEGLAKSTGRDSSRAQCPARA